MVLAAALLGTVGWAGQAAWAAPLQLKGGVAEKQVEPQGHKPPPKGEMVSEMREDLTDEIDGPETVIRLYEDAGGTRVREFVVNGYTFQIEVTPFRGPSYYLMDTKGDGLFDESWYGHEPKLVVPQWVLFRF